MFKKGEKKCLVNNAGASFHMKKFFRSMNTNLFFHCQIDRGLLVYVCFLKGCTREVLGKMGEYVKVNNFIFVSD